MGWKSDNMKIAPRELMQHLGFNLGYAVDHIWKASHEQDEEENLRAAIGHLQDELHSLLVAKNSV